MGDQAPDLQDGGHMWVLAEVESLAQIFTDRHERMVS